MNKRLTEFWVVQIQKTGEFLGFDDGLPALFKDRADAETAALEFENGDDYRPVLARLAVTAGGAHE